MRQVEIPKNPKIIRMSRNSLLIELENKEVVWIHRNVLNKVLCNPELPTFITLKDFQGTIMPWIATLSTL